jgi:hypothetical protein
MNIDNDTLISGNISGVGETKFVLSVTLNADFPISIVISPSPAYRVSWKDVF